MDTNVGSLDKQVRIAFGAISGIGAILALTGVIGLPMILAPVLGLLSIIALGTGLTGTCGLYAILGVNTCSVKS
jgi:hypothetical protein